MNEKGSLQHSQYFLYYFEYEWIELIRQDIHAVRPRRYSILELPGTRSTTTGSTAVVLEQYEYSEYILEC